MLPPTTFSLGIIFSSFFGRNWHEFGDKNSKLYRIKNVRERKVNLKWYRSDPISMGFMLNLLLISFNPRQICLQEKVLNKTCSGRYKQKSSGKKKKNKIDVREARKVVNKNLLSFNEFSYLHSVFGKQVSCFSDPHSKTQVRFTATIWDRTINKAKVTWEDNLSSHRFTIQ